MIAEDAEKNLCKVLGSSKPLKNSLRPSAYNLCVLCVEYFHSSHRPLVNRGLTPPVRTAVQAERRRVG